MKPLVSDRTWFVLFLASMWLLSIIATVNITSGELEEVFNAELEERDAEIAAPTLKNTPSPLRGEGRGEGESFHEELAACLSGLDACVEDARMMAAYVTLCECHIDHASYEGGRD